MRVLAVAFLAACGGAASAAASARALLVVRAPVADAAVWVDEQLVGEVGALPDGVALAPGPHRIEVRHDRYHTRYFMVTLRAGEQRTLEVTMAEELR